MKKRKKLLAVVEYDEQKVRKDEQEKIDIHVLLPFFPAFSLFFLMFANADTSFPIYFPFFKLFSPVFYENASLPFVPCEMIVFENGSEKNKKDKK